jgi:hypothetical protein
MNQVIDNMFYPMQLMVDDVFVVDYYLMKQDKKQDHQYL